MVVSMDLYISQCREEGSYVGAGFRGLGGFTSPWSALLQVHRGLRHGWRDLLECCWHGI
jgi:hypothetical protein